MTTSPGAPRTGDWKYQAGHAFVRGQPVYLQAEDTYALATRSTGFDGVVGDTALNRFELVTGGQLDKLTGLVPGLTYSLGTTPGTLVVGSTHPVGKALAPNLLRISGTGEDAGSSDVVLPFTVSVTPIPNGVPQARNDSTIHPQWIPALPYEPEGAVAAHVASAHPHDPIYVRTPEGGGILDIEEGSLVFDVDDLTQVLDAAFI